MIKQKIPYIYFAIPFLLLAVLTGLNYPKVKDEPFYYTTITNFPRIYSNATNIEKYTEPVQTAYTKRTLSLPGYFAMQSLIGKLIGFQIWKLRLTNVIFGLFAIFVFFKMLTQLEWLKINRDVAIFTSLVLLLNPYFFMTSFLIYTDIPALCFALLGMYFYLQRKNLISVVFLSLSIFTRQIYIFLPVAIILAEILQKKSKPFKPQIFIYTFPFLVLLVAIWLWKGQKQLLWQYIPYSSPQAAWLWQDHEWVLQQYFPSSLYEFFNFYSVNKFIISVGVYAIPFILLNPKRFFKKANFVVSLSFLPILFINLINPRFYAWLFGARAGIFSSTIIKLSDAISFFPLRYVFLLFWFLGILVLAEAFSNTSRDKRLNFFHFQIIVCAAIMFFAWLFWEKYIMMIQPSIFILLAYQMKPPNKILAYTIVSFLYIINMAGFYFSVIL